MENGDKRRVQGGNPFNAAEDGHKPVKKGGEI